MDKKLIGRFVPKGDVEANWKKAVGFIPLDKEIIIYKPDKNYSYARMKIGDGKTGVNDLPFVIDVNGNIASKEWVEEQAQALGLSLQEYVNSSIQGLATEEYVDEKIAAIEIPSIPENLATEEYVDNAVIEVIQPIEDKNNKQDDKIAELEGRITYITFDVKKNSEWEKTAFTDITGATIIDWGDGYINLEKEHIYENPGIYICKIYDAISVGSDLTSIYLNPITSIKLGNTIISLQENAFNYNSFLQFVQLNNTIKEIPQRAFQNCSSLMSIEISDSVTNISDYTFAYCSSLTSVEIGDSVTSIGVDAFYGCSSLTSVVFKNQNPITYTSYSPWFTNCTSLTHIYVPYDCKQAYIDKWTVDGATQDILDKIVESDREAMMSDVNALKSEIQAELVGKTDYLGTVAAMTDLSTIAGAGDYHRVSTEFVYDESTGEKAHVGDILIAVIDLVGLVNTQTKEYWDLVHTELGAAPATQEDINSIFEEV